MMQQKRKSSSLDPLPSSLQPRPQHQIEKQDVPNRHTARRSCSPHTYPPKQERQSCSPDAAPIAKQARKSYSPSSKTVILQAPSKTAMFTSRCSLTTTRTFCKRQRIIIPQTTTEQLLPPASPTTTLRRKFPTRLRSESGQTTILRKRSPSAAARRRK